MLSLHMAHHGCHQDKQHTPAGWSTLHATKPWRGARGMANRATSEVARDSKCYSTSKQQHCSPAGICRGEAWANSGGKASHSTIPHPTQAAQPGSERRSVSRSHAGPIMQWAARWGSVGAAGSRASPGGDGAPTAAHKPSSVLLSREQKAAGCWPAVLAPSLAAVRPLPANSSPLAAPTGGPIRVGQGRRKVGSPFLSPATSEAATGGHLWAVITHAPHHPAVLPVILLCSPLPCHDCHHPTELPPPLCDPHHLTTLPTTLLCSLPSCCAPPTRGCSFLPPALGHPGTHSLSPQGCWGSGAGCSSALGGCSEVKGDAVRCRGMQCSVWVCSKGAVREKVGCRGVQGAVCVSAGRVQGTAVQCVWVQ